MRIWINNNQITLLICLGQVFLNNLDSRWKWTKSCNRDHLLELPDVLLPAGSDISRDDRIVTDYNLGTSISSEASRNDFPRRDEDPAAINSSNEGGGGGGNVAGTKEVAVTMMNQ